MKYAPFVYTLLYVLLVISVAAFDPAECYEAWMTAGQTTGPFVTTFNETLAQIPGA